jgi:hypothetical protein
MQRISCIFGISENPLSEEAFKKKLEGWKAMEKAEVELSDQI